MSKSNCILELEILTFGNRKFVHHCQTKARIVVIREEAAWKVVIEENDIESLPHFPGPNLRTNLEGNGGRDIDMGQNTRDRRCGGV